MGRGNYQKSLMRGAGGNGWHEAGENMHPWASQSHCFAGRGPSEMCSFHSLFLHSELSISMYKAFSYDLLTKRTTQLFLSFIIHNFISLSVSSIWIGNSLMGLFCAVLLIQDMTRNTGLWKGQEPRPLDCCVAPTDTAHPIHFLWAIYGT